MKSTLQEMVRQIRGFTRQLLSTTNPAWILFAPVGTSNHMLWHAGHAVWVNDRLCIERLVGKSELPDGWAVKFGMDCEPVSEQKDWPELAEVQTLLAQQETRLLELIDQMTPEQLVIRQDDNRDLIGGIIHGLHDEAKHHGEMYLLHKLCQANAENESE